MGYQAGNLELSILGFSKEAVASVDLTAKALRRLASAVDTINNTQFVFAGQKLEVLFTKIANATNSINTTNIVNLASAAKSLSSISRLSNLEKMDFNKVGKGFETLAIAIQPFLNKVKEAEASLASLDSILRRVNGKKIQGLLGGNDDSSPNKKGLFGLAKTGMILHTARRIGRVMADLVQAGSDYYETLNLWQVAMRNNLDVADKFINKMQRAYGISSKTLMNAQAVFKNMVGSLGQISEATAYALSEALVQMSADYASLYNRTLESAFQNMQSMLAGQVRPIRSAGLDMTETTLYQFYQELGGTKTMRQLNRTEKQLLSILAVYQQMGSAGALGDMTKTLNQFANQSRMMTEYWAELKTWSGLIIKDFLEDLGILTKINAALITVTEIIKAIAKSRGLGDENFTEGIFESVEATNEEIDKLQGKLLDFDKFRSLEGATTSPISVDEKVIEAITGYSSKVEEAVNDAQILAEQWLIALGATRDVNGELIFTDEALDNITGKVSGFGAIISSLLGTSMLPKIKSFISQIGKSWTTIISSFGLIMKLAKAHPILAAIAAIVVVLIHLYQTNETVRNSVNQLFGAFMPFIKLVGGTLFSVFNALGNLLLSVSDIFGGFFSIILTGTAYPVNLLIVALNGVWVVIEAVTKAFSSLVEIIVSLFKLDFSKLGENLTEIWRGEWLSIEAVKESWKNFKRIKWEPVWEQFSPEVVDSEVVQNSQTVVSPTSYIPQNYNVANNTQQQKTVQVQALNEWWRTARNDIPVFQGVSNSGIYTIVDGEANRRGKKFANV